MTGQHADFSAVVLISGGGSNLQALIDAIAAQALNIRIAAVISNKPNAGGLLRAKKAGIDALALQNTDYPNREQFDAALSTILDKYAPDIILLAGFMRILTASFVHRYAGRIINIHPSLLPKYPGLHTHQRALDDDAREHGCTVHFVTEELDGGPCIVQGRVPILEGDDVAQLAARVLKIEHKIYPHAVKLIASGRLVYRKGESWMDGERLLEPLQI